MTTSFRDIPNYANELEDNPDLLSAAEALLDGKPQSPHDFGSILRDLENFLRQYVILPEFTSLPLALWTLMTYIFELFDAVPYLVIVSPTPRCGKTRLLECLELVVSSPRRASNISEAALFRTIQKCAPTLLLDEAETLDSKGERAEHLRQILNAGNRRGAVVTRCDKQNFTIEDFSVFGPKVLARIGTFPQTITDRAIVIGMQRRQHFETVNRFLYRRANPEGDSLRMRASTFVRMRQGEIRVAYEAIELGFISDREAEAWAPLFAILSVANPERLPELRASAEHLTRSKNANTEDDSLILRLLSDIRDIWTEREPKIFSADLVARLRRIEDSPWSSDERFNERKLARLLRPFGLTAATQRIGSKTLKGYVWESAVTVFSRYLVPRG
jgi:hypothetical protein